LAAIVVAGLFVMLFGLLKVGRLSDFFPSAAVHGMLAAIGIIIIIKQAYPAIGVAPKKGAELIELAAELPAKIMETNPVIALIAALSLAILIIYPRIKNKWIRLVPAPMWVMLIAAIPMTFLFDLLHHHEYTLGGHSYDLDPKYLVQLPERITDGIVFPNFGKIASSDFWVAVLTIAIVSGLESLLSAKAVDTLDPWKRKSNLNKDLVALGGGSSAAAAIGGLPMISEIVRSSANISNGARTPWANFFHGSFLLIFLFLLKDIIMDIPNAALAAMLIFTGFRLASPKEFKHMAELGVRQIAVFVTTIALVILVDLLVGIAAGMVLEMVLNFAVGGKLKAFIRAHAVVKPESGRTVLLLSQSLTFTNYLSLKKRIDQQKEASVLMLDFTDVSLIDHTVLANLYDVQADFRKAGRQLVFENLNQLAPATRHPLAPRRKGVAVATNDLSQELDARQMRMLKFAIQQHHQFIPETWEGHDEWTAFTSMHGKTIVKARNIFEKRNGTHALTVADLKMSTGALITLEEEERTVMRIELKGLVIPEFSMTRERNINKVAEHLGAQDIDFENFPVFSDHFLLSGDDEAAIRQFFAPERIRFHEENKDYYLDSNGTSILVTTSGHLLEEAGIERLLQFGKEIVASLFPKKEKELVK
ncbi:MAG: SulP family inorganic anion transporter, partial [Bacteroidia bacterium]